MRALAVLGLLVPGIAEAQASRDPQALCNARIESIEDGVTCGNYYTALYARDPTAKWHDETLYNAGVSFEIGRSFTAALSAYAQLRRQYPASKIARAALARSARIYSNLVMYDRAAELLEEYATKYAGEKDAYDAMSDAVFYRRALGHDDKAIANTAYFVKTFGKSKPQEAAAAYFSLTPIYERRGDKDATMKHLQQYVRMWGTKGGDDRIVIAYAKLGELAWEATCPVKQIDGECVKVKRTKKTTCGTDTTVQIVKRKDTKKALEFLAAAIKHYEKRGGAVGGDEAGARYYYAHSRLLRADAERDQIAATDANTRSSLQSKYESVIAVNDAATSVHATARIARMYDAAATALETGADCGRSNAAFQNLRTSATLAYTVCLEQATKLAFFDAEGGRACERRLQQLDPESVPPLHELRASPQNASVTATEPSL